MEISEKLKLLEKEIERECKINGSNGVEFDRIKCKLSWEQCPRCYLYSIRTYRWE